MKKIITLLTVGLLIATTAFAGVTFGGEIKAGYGLNWSENGFDAIKYGQDGLATDMAKLNLKVADDNGLWNATMQGAIKTDNSGAVDATLTLDVAKIIAAAAGLEDMPVSVALSLVGNDRITVLRAYNNVADNSTDRIRSTAHGWGTNLVVGYEDLVQVQVGVLPKVTTVLADPTAKPDPVEKAVTADTAVVTSALVNPVNGVKVSAGYTYNGDTKSTHAFTAAADLDVAKLAGLDGSFGISVADIIKWTGDVKNNTFATTLYGTVAKIGLYGEYVLTTADATTHGFQIGANFGGLVDHLILDAYFGSTDAAKFADMWFIGGNVGYEVSGITLNLGVEYAKGDKKNYVPGFNLVPSVKVAF